MELVKLTEEEFRVLSRFLNNLCSETSWINAKWVDEASAHEVAIIHQIRHKLISG